MIEEHISKPRLMFENYPTYLVPDTNCFVDHLDGLRAIVACQAFTLIVPLIGKAVLFMSSISLCQLPLYSWEESDSEIIFLKAPPPPLGQIDKFYETGYTQYQFCRHFPFEHTDPP